jgi:hypothetical protein
MYLPRDLGEVISARYVLADRAAVEQPKPVNHRPPRSMGNDLELAEMMAPILIISTTNKQGHRSRLHEQSISVCHGVLSSNKIRQDDVGDECSDTSDGVDTLI